MLDTPDEYNDNVATSELYLIMALRKQDTDYAIYLIDSFPCF